MIGLPPALTPSPHVDFRQTQNLYLDNQGSSDRCVGESFAGAGYIATGTRWSPRGIYVGARAREVQRAKGAPIPDIGCDPHDAAEGCVAMGVYPRDTRDDDPSQATALINWDEATKSQPCQATDFHFVNSGDLETTDLYITAGYGVVQWMMIDQSWETLSSPIWSGMTGAPVGGHAVVKIGYTGLTDNDYEIIWNSYGSTWGEGGFCRILRGYCRKNVIGYCSITGGPRV